jgi:hypothetical protein
MSDGGPERVSAQFVSNQRKCISQQLSGKEIFFFARRKLAGNVIPIDSVIRCDNILKRKECEWDIVAADTLARM